MKHCTFFGSTCSINIARLLLHLNSDIYVISWLFVEGPDEIFAAVLFRTSNMRRARNNLKILRRLVAIFLAKYCHLVSYVVKSTQNICGSTEQLNSSILFILELSCDGRPVCYQPGQQGASVMSSVTSGYISTRESRTLNRDKRILFNYSKVE